MEDLIFSLNATMPVFIMMVLGYFLRQIGIIDDVFASKMNKFVFLIPLPLLLFSQLSEVDFSTVLDIRFVLFCFVSTAVCIAVAFLLSLFIKNRSLRGEFIQASYRSSAALLGIAFINNIYGETGFAPLMIIGSVPLYNIMAVAVLSFTSPNRTGSRSNKKVFAQTLKGIFTNPIIIGIVFGLVWSAFRLPVPAIPSKVITSIGNVATPLGLMAMGASVNIKKTADNILPALGASFMKLFGFAALILPAAVIMGFRNTQLTAILIMLTSATTVSSFVMAKNMGHEGTLTSSAVMITTILSAFSVTLWLYVLRSLSLI